MLPAAFDVTGLAAASVGAAVGAAADLLAARTGDTPRAAGVDTRRRLRRLRPRAPVRTRGLDAAGPVGPDRGRLPRRRRLDPAAHQLRAPPRRRAGRARASRPTGTRWHAPSPAGPPRSWSRPSSPPAAAPPCSTTATPGWRHRPVPRPATSRSSGGRPRAPWPPATLLHCAAVRRAARARPDPGDRRAGVHPLPRRARGRRAAHRPARLRRGAGPGAGDDDRQAHRVPRPARRRPCRASSSCSPAPTSSSAACGRTPSTGSASTPSGCASSTPGSSSPGSTPTAGTARGRTGAGSTASCR